MRPRRHGENSLNRHGKGCFVGIFRLRARQNARERLDFDGNGAGVGDVLEFAGYGISPTFTSIDASHWEVNYNNNPAHDFIDFSNVPSIDRFPSLPRQSP